MARVTRTTKTTRSAPSGRKPGRPATAPVQAAKARSPKNHSPARKPAISKDELRAQVAKLERANARLRARSREANRAAKTAAAHIAELEDRVARLEKQVTSPPPAVRRARPPGATSRTRRPEQDRDPGDAVPPGVAVEAPAPLDEEAEAARENLEQHLGGE